VAFLFWLFALVLVVVLHPNVNQSIEQLKQSIKTINRTINQTINRNNQSINQWRQTSIKSHQSEKMGVKLAFVKFE
jgi:uncharacterized protein YoxC